MADGSDDKAQRLIKQVHRAGGRSLSDDEVREFLRGDIYRFTPAPPAAPRRGPKPKTSPLARAYEAAATRRRGLWHKLYRLPENWEKTADTRRRAGQSLMAILDELIPRLEAEGVKPYQLRRRILKEFTDRRLAPPSERHLSRLINKRVRTKK